MPYLTSLRVLGVFGGGRGRLGGGSRCLEDLCLVKVRIRLLGLGMWITGNEGEVGGGDGVDEAV